MGQKIVSKPLSRDGLKNFDKIFRKNNTPNASGRASSDTSAPLGVTSDENVDWGEFKTIICCTDDPHFGG
jgi:hypothetical protein